MASSSGHETSDQKIQEDRVEQLAAAEALKEKSTAGKDRAAELLLNADPTITVTPEDDARILRKIDLTILPILLVVYFLQQLDKSTLSYASVFGIIQNAHLVGQDYSWLGSIVYIAQLVMQPIIAYFLVKFPTGKFAAVMICCWGIILSCMSVANTYKSLLATRFLLGVFEASVGLFPLRQYG